MSYTNESGDTTESQGDYRPRHSMSPTTRDFTAEAAENAENGTKQGNGRKTTGDPDSKAQENSPFSAVSAISAVKK